jgi:hypothetical protein
MTTTYPTLQDILDTANEMCDYGMCTLNIVFRHNTLEFLVSGDPKHQCLLLSMEALMQRALRADSPALCLLCDSTFGEHRPPTAFAILATDSGRNPPNAMGSCLCEDCSMRSPSADVADRVLQRYQEMFSADNMCIATHPNVQ